MNAARLGLASRVAAIALLLLFTHTSRADDTPLRSAGADASVTTRVALGTQLAPHIRAMPELVLGLLAKIEAIAKYPEATSFPRINRVERTELERQACAGQRCRYVRAAYIPEKGLFLDSALDPHASLMDRSILLHELVHHMQALHPRYADLPPCERRREEEREAFAIQNAYLAQQGGAGYIRFPEQMYRCESEG